MSTRNEASQAQARLIGKYCHGCNKYLPAENFSSLKKGGNRKCDKCAVNHSKPKGVAVDGAALSYKPKYRG